LSKLKKKIIICPRILLKKAVITKRTEKTAQGKCCPFKYHFKEDT